MSQLLFEGTFNLNGTSTPDVIPIGSPAPEHIIDKVFFAYKNQDVNNARQPILYADVDQYGNGINQISMGNSPDGIRDRLNATARPTDYNKVYYGTDTEGEFTPWEGRIVGQNLYIRIFDPEGAPCECYMAVWGYPVNR